MSSDSDGTATGSNESVSSQMQIPEASLHVSSTIDQEVLRNSSVGTCEFMPRSHVLAHECEDPGIHELALAELDSLVSKLCSTSTAYQGTVDDLSDSVNPSAEFALKMRKIRAGLHNKYEWRAVMKDEPSIWYSAPFPPAPVYETIMSADDSNDSSLQRGTCHASTSHESLDLALQDALIQDHCDKEIQDVAWSCPEIRSPKQASVFEHCKVDLVFIFCLNVLCPERAQKQVSESIFRYYFLVN